MWNLKGFRLEEGRVWLGPCAKTRAFLNKRIHVSVNGSFEKCRYIVFPELAGVLQDAYIRTRVFSRDWDPYFSVS